MFETADLNKIKECINEFFTKTSFSVEIEGISVADQTISVIAKTDMPQILIGENGQTLAEIQRLLKLILKKHLPAPFYLDIDINNYKRQKKEYLKEIAKAAADEVSLFKKEKILPAMPAFERRIIHTALADRSDIFSESVGEEPERKIVIRPK